MLFAELVDPISGGAGWVGAGLLGAVLAWLMLKHLPDKDKQIKELVDTMNSQVKEVIAQKTAALATLTTAAQASLDKVTSHCAEEMKEVTTAFKYEIDRMFELAKNSKPRG